MEYKVRIYGDPVLRENTDIITDFDSNLSDTGNSMIETMYVGNGIGLAAPQVGLSKKIVVIDTSFGEDTHSAIQLINPEIVKTEGECILEEGCLSIPGIYEEIARPEKIKVHYYDINGNEQSLEADGLLARVIQHELDHLDGVLFVDRLSTIKRSLLAKTLRSMAEEGNSV
jgi:peptide deformylase